MFLCREFKFDAAHNLVITMASAKGCMGIHTGSP